MNHRFPPPATAAVPGPRRSAPVRQRAGTRAGRCGLAGPGSTGFPAPATPQKTPESADEPPFPDSHTRGRPQPAPARHRAGTRAGRRGLVRPGATGPQPAPFPGELPSPLMNHPLPTSAAVAAAELRHPRARRGAAMRARASHRGDIGPGSAHPPRTPFPGTPEHADEPTASHLDRHRGPRPAWPAARPASPATGPACPAAAVRAACHPRRESATAVLPGPALRVPKLTPFPGERLSTPMNHTLPAFAAVAVPAPFRPTPRRRVHASSCRAARPASRGPPAPALPGTALLIPSPRHSPEKRPSTLMNHSLPTFTAVAVADPRRPATGPARPAYPRWSAEPPRTATPAGAPAPVRPPTFTNLPPRRPI
jgi:hypothetical protein